MKLFEKDIIQISNTHSNCSHFPSYDSREAFDVITEGKHPGSNTCVKRSTCLDLHRHEIDHEEKPCVLVP